MLKCVQWASQHGQSRHVHCATCMDVNSLSIIANNHIVKVNQKMHHYHWQIENQQTLSNNKTVQKKNKVVVIILCLLYQLNRKMHKTYKWMVTMMLRLIVTTIIKRWMCLPHVNHLALPSYHNLDVNVSLLGTTKNIMIRVKKIIKRTLRISLSHQIIYTRWCRRLVSSSVADDSNSNSNNNSYVVVAPKLLKPMWMCFRS